jgi:hypothetical protein
MKEQLYLLFENYLNNELSQEERLELENRLQNDAEIQDKFELYKQTNQFLSVKFDAKSIDFKQNLNAISQEHFASKRSKVIAFQPWQYAVAASMVLFFGLWFLMSGNPQYSDFNQHEQAYFVERSAHDKNLNEAQKFFNEKRYKKAIVSFEKIDDLTNPELQYFYAIALIETAHYKQAEIYLKNLKSGTSVYKHKATWYLALSYLKQDKLKECKIYLEQVPADAEEYVKAQKLLKDLE